MHERSIKIETNKQNSHVVWILCLYVHNLLTISNVKQDHRKHFIYVSNNIIASNKKMHKDSSQNKNKIKQIHVFFYYSESKTPLSLKVILVIFACCTIASSLIAAKKKLTECNYCGTCMFQAFHWLTFFSLLQIYSGTSWDILSSPENKNP